MYKRQVEEDQLVGPLCVVPAGDLDRVAGVPQADELDALDDAAVPRLAGVIVGKALYEGRFDVRAGLAALAGVPS